MSSHPQTVPPGRRTVDTRHLPNPATLPLQLQRAHTVRGLTHNDFNGITCVAFLFCREKHLKDENCSCGLAVPTWIFGKQDFSQIYWKGLNPKDPHRCFSRLHCRNLKMVPSLDVWVESSCFCYGVGIKAFRMISTTSPNYQDYVLPRIVDKAVCAWKKRPLADVKVPSLTFSVCKAFFFTWMTGSSKTLGRPPLV